MSGKSDYIEEDDEERREEQQRSEEMAVYESYIIGMLTNFDSMRLDRIQVYTIFQLLFCSVDNVIVCIISLFGYLVFRCCCPVAFVFEELASCVCVFLYDFLFFLSFRVCSFPLNYLFFIRFVFLVIPFFLLCLQNMLKMFATDPPYDKVKELLSSPICSALAARCFFYLIHLFFIYFNLLTSRRALLCVAFGFGCLADLLVPGGLRSLFLTDCPRFVSSIGFERAFSLSKNRLKTSFRRSSAKWSSREKLNSKTERTN